MDINKNFKIKILITCFVAILRAASQILRSNLQFRASSDLRGSHHDFYEFSIPANNTGKPAKHSWSAEQWFHMREKEGQEVALDSGRYAVQHAKDCKELNNYLHFWEFINNLCQFIM